MRALARRALDAAGRRWRTRLTATATDATDRLTGRDLLVLAPHPDDETFGCGALIARARAAGARVTVAVATDGARSATSDRLGPQDLAVLRRGELREACARLGVGEVRELGYADGTLALRLPQLTADVTDLIRELRPDVVLVPCLQDQHPDHQALHRATLDAHSATVGKVPDLLGYPVWTWHAAPVFRAARRAAWPRLWWWASRQPGTGRWWRVPTGAFVAAKRHAVAAHRSQVTNYSGESGWSFLPPSFVELFLGADELFLPVRTG